MVGVPAQSSDAVTVKLTTAEHEPGSLHTSLSSGQLMTGLQRTLPKFRSEVSATPTVPSLTLKLSDLESFLSKWSTVGSPGSMKVVSMGSPLASVCRINSTLYSPPLLDVSLNGIN